MTESEIKAYIASEVTAQLQAITSKDIASESDVPTLSDAEWDTNNSITSLPVVYNGSAWRKIGAGFLRTLRNAAAVVSTAWNALKNNGTNVSWIPTVDTSGNAGKTSPADLAAVLGVKALSVSTWNTEEEYIYKGGITPAPYHETGYGGSIRLSDGLSGIEIALFRNDSLYGIRIRGIWDNATTPWVDIKQIGEG